MNTEIELITKNGTSEQLKRIIGVKHYITDYDEVNYYSQFQTDEQIAKEVEKHRKIGYKVCENESTNNVIDHALSSQKEIISSTADKQKEVMTSTINLLINRLDSSFDENNRSVKDKMKNYHQIIKDDLDRYLKVMYQEIESKIGKGSVFINTLDPNNKESFLNVMNEMLEKNKKDLSETVQNQFSKDHPESFFSKMIANQEEKHNALKRDMDEFMLKVSEKWKFEEGKQSEYDKGTRKGIDYENKLYEQHIVPKSHSLMDEVELVKGTPGLIDRCKTGDYLITTGEYTGAPGKKIVMEVKNGKDIKLENAKKELKKAKKNRDADIGIFVCSDSCAPPEIGNFKRIGNDFFVTAADDLESDQSAFFVNAAYEISRGIIVSESRALQKNNIDTKFILSRIDEAIFSMSKIDTIVTKAKTISNNGTAVVEIANELKNDLQNDLVSISSMLESSSDKCKS